MNIKALCLLAFGLAAGTASAQSFDCTGTNGGKICQDLKDITYYMDYSCTGDACDNVWQDEIDAMATFARDYRALVPFGTPVTVQVGQLAQTAAQQICGASETSDTCDWIQALFNAKSDALPLLSDLQKNAGTATPYTCQLSYSCN